MPIPIPGKNPKEKKKKRKKNPKEEIWMLRTVKPERDIVGGLDERGCELDLFDIDSPLRSTDLLQKRIVLPGCIINCLLSDISPSFCGLLMSYLF
jgi:hypothetical protein